MNSLYAKKLAIFSIVSGSLSLYFYLLRALTRNDFRMLIPTVISALLFIIFGLTIIVKNRRNNGNIKLFVIGLLILWLLLEITIIIIFLLTLTDPLLMLIVFLYPLYPIYCGFKFCYFSKNLN